MSNARHLADLLDTSGDVKLGHLDNVPPSNDASALTTGTLPAARIGIGDAGKVLQTVSSELTANVSTSTGSFSTGNTGLSVTITPLLASSNLLVFCPLTVGNAYGTYNNNYFNIWRDGNAMTSIGSGYGQWQMNTGTGRNFSYLGRITPANNTNATTFNLRFAMAGGTTVYVWADNQLIVQEIAT